MSGVSVPFMVYHAHETNSVVEMGGFDGNFYLLSTERMNGRCTSLHRGRLCTARDVENGCPKKGLGRTGDQT